VGVDSVLAHIRRGASGCDFPAREISDGSPFVPDSAVGVAFLGGVRGFGLDTDFSCRFTCAVAVEEALIGACISQDIEHSKPARRNQVVFEQGLFAVGKARHVRGRVSPVLSERPGIDYRLA
jgi:hypothetical protein